MKREKERGEKERRKKKIIVVMASRRRAMKELGRVTFSPDTTSGGGSPRVSLRDLPKRKRNIFKINKTTEEVRKIKIKHTYTMNAHAKTIQKEKVREIKVREKK